jgi:hypothetical protein
VVFVASFFVKNMIIVILFATFVSLFFQSTLRYGDAATEGMETKEEGEKKKKMIKQTIKQMIKTKDLNFPIKVKNRI